MGLRSGPMTTRIPSELRTLRKYPDPSHHGFGISDVLLGEIVWLQGCNHDHPAALASHFKRDSNLGFDAESFPDAA